MPFVQLAHRLKTSSSFVIANMGFSGLNTTGNAAAFFVLVLAIPLSIIATGLRFLATRKAGRKPGLEDWLALVALVAMILCASLQLSGV